MSQRCHKQMPSRIHRYPSCLLAPALASQRLTLVIFSERDWNGEGLVHLLSCTLPRTRRTLYAEWTDIELVRELPLGRAEVPVFVLAASMPSAGVALQ
jgi:hypothetical protein